MADKPLIKPKSATSIYGENDGEKVKELKLTQLFPFVNHPFKVQEDDSLAELMESISNHGVSNPIIVRPKDRGEYEIIAGHRRVKACELLGKESIPTFIRKLDDEEAVFQMVDTNIQREQLLPSEKAFAYKMKAEAMKRKNGRPKNSGQVVPSFEQGKVTTDLVGDTVGESGRQVKRYIRLTFLIQDFLEQVDLKKLPFNTAVELSYLTHEEQENVHQTMVQRTLTPSQEQATSLKKCSQEGKLNLTVIESILVPLQAQPKKTSLKLDTSKFFPKDTPKAEMEQLVVHLLEEWQARQGQTVQT